MKKYCLILPDFNCVSIPVKRARDLGWHDYGIGDTVCDGATELILDVTRVLSIIKLCI